jgi:hypothetical protein
MIAPYARQQIFASVSLRDGVRQCRRSSNAVPRHTRTTRSSHTSISLPQVRTDGPRSSDR